MPNSARPRPGLSAILAGDAAGFMTMAMAAGAGAALLITAVTPAHSRPLELKSSARPQVYAAATRAKVAKEEHDEVAAKAKASKLPLSIVISIEKQHLTLYSGTEPIAQTRVSTGRADHPTPMGVFSIIQKDRWHRSNIYDDAPMYYMQRITWSGVAMHQGYVPGYPASHGCIRLPEAFAKQMWGITGLGVRVIIARSELSPAPFADPHLFVFKEPQPPAPKPEPTESVASSNEVVRAAYNAFGAGDLANSTTGAASTITDVVKPLDPALNAAAKEKPLKPGPIAVFISRKEGKIFVRKGFDPVFDAPVTFEQPEQPLGTHVFTAQSFKDDNSTLNWTLVTVPTTHVHTKKVERPRKGQPVVQAPPAPVVAPSTATEALARVNIPQDARQRIEALMSPGASLVISDQGLGGETGRGTDFIVVTR